MTIFGNDKNTRGCFLVLRLNTSEGRGAQLDLGADGMWPNDDYAYPLTVTGFRFTEMEIAQFLKCFGDYVYTYAFGHDPNQSQLIVEFTGMLRKGLVYQRGGGNGGQNGYSHIVDMIAYDYSEYRVSKGKKYVRFWVGGAQVLKGFLVGLTSASLDPQYSLQSFTALIQLVEVQGR